jgi:ribA/ribD-fused uncharacterized protein
MNWVSEEGQTHEDAVTFFKVSEEFGGLSNMSGAYPLRVNGNRVGSSEALYQACRFPHQPDWQKEIIGQASPMAAKMKAKKDGRRDRHSRPDWGAVCVELMRWVLRVKLCQHHDAVAALLRRSGERAIVEVSKKDTTWGAVERDGILHGRNQLGRLLMELRDEVRRRPRAELEVVAPLTIPDFLLLGEPIGAVRPARGLG